MKTLYCLVLILLVSPFKDANAQFFRSKDNFSDFHSKYEVLDFNFNALYKNIEQQTDGIVTLELGQYGVFKCQVSTSNLLMNQAETFIQNGNQRIVLPRAKEHQWKGKVYGSSKMLRLNVYANCLSGMIELDSGSLCFETFLDEGKPRLIVYNSLHNIAQNKGPFCALDNQESKTAPVSSSKRGIEYVDFTCRILKIGCVASYRLFASHQFDTVATFNEVRDVLNISDATYSKYAGIRIRVAFEAISLDSTALYNTSNSTGDRFTSFAKKTSQFSGKLIPDVFHLFCESYLLHPNDPSIGMAYLSGACNNGINTSVSTGYFGSLAFWAHVVSHELGHNLSAEHFQSSNCSGSGSLMCPAAQRSATYMNTAEANAIKSFTSSSVGCMEYPVPYKVKDFNLNGRDSVLVPIVSDKDFKTIYYRQYASNIYTDVSNKKELWIKSPGYNYFTYSLDTLSGLNCRYENEFFVANNDFVVRNTNVNGAGSLGNAILNSNVVFGMDTIIFALPDSENVIEIDTLLPLVYDSVFIDGSSQKGFERMSANKPYRPAVTLRTKSPVPNSSDFVCFRLGRKKYIIKGFSIEGFSDGIHANIDNFKYYPQYKSLYFNFKDSNYTAIYEVIGNKFLNNRLAFYVNSFELNNSKDKIVLGGDSLSDGNVFLSTVNSCTRFAYTQSASVKNNFFGYEPGVDTFKTFQSGVVVNGGSNINISNNYFGRFSNNGIEAINCDGEIMNNTFGQNFFSKQISNYSGRGIQTFGWSNNGMLKIGDTLQGKGNVFFGKKNAAVISFSSSSNTFAQGNMVYATDTASICVDGKYTPKPYKNLGLDSVEYSCANGNVFTAHGFVTSSIADDTMYLHFYSVPKGVKTKREPMQRYLGFKQIICLDTFETKFTHILPNAKNNEGVIFTASSQKRKQTGINSNAAYPKDMESDPIQISKDTCICPQQTVFLYFDSKYSVVKLDGKAVSKQYTMTKPGVYNFETVDSKNCFGAKTVILNSYPNYLSDVQIMGNPFYYKNILSTYYLYPYSMQKNWKTFAWSAANSTLGISLKLNTDITFTEDSSTLYYAITDVNKCSYKISRKLSYRLPSSIDSIQYNKSNLIYPNPIKGTGRLFFEKPVSGLIQIYDALGQKVYEQSANLEGVYFIDLNLKAKGLYWIKMDREGVYSLVVD